MKYKAVLFDLDGTLLDTLQDLADAVNFGLDQLKFPGHQPEEYKLFIGAGREVLAALSIPEGERHLDIINRLSSYIDEYYDQHWADHTLPYPGIPNLLNELTNNGTKMAILSNKPQNFTKINVSRLLSGWSFAAVIGALPGVPNKPDPGSALKIALQLDIDPSQFLYLGDSGIDMQTAVAAGMYPVGALWGFRTCEELKECGAKTLIEKPIQLLRFLE